MHPTLIPTVLDKILMASISFDTTSVREYLMASLIDDDELGCQEAPITKRVTKEILKYILQATTLSQSSIQFDL